MLQQLSERTSSDNKDFNLAHSGFRMAGSSKLTAGWYERLREVLASERPYTLYRLY